MCGFLGFVGDRERAAAIDLDVALASLRHRGPDDRGVFSSLPTPNSSLLTPHSPACVLAHTRLAIIDLSAAAHQPMTTADGRYTIVYNGEVYNFRELRQELGVRSKESGVGSQEWLSDSDTEVVLRAYAAWGKDCVKRFRGMFAFAIWDARERALFFARDRFGVKPFYYAATSDSFAFASEVRALLETGVAERTLSREGMARYLLFGSVYDPWTLVDGVRALLPAHRGEVRNGVVSIERYWDLPVETVPMTFDEAVERVRPILRDAVACELVSDVPLGIFLSGGVDSSAIVAFATESAASPVHTFTLTFDEEDYNEERYAAEVAAHFGCDHHQVYLPAGKALAEIESVFAAADQPSADGVNTYFVSKAAREAGLVVALSGLGGDELFAGYGSSRSFATLMRAGNLARVLPRSVARLIGGVHAFNGRSMRTKKMAEVLAARGCAGATYAASRAMFTPQQAAHLAPDLRAEIDEAWASCAAPAGGSDSVAAYSRFELTGYLRNTLLRDSDAMSMANSIELRVPLLDHILAEAVLPIPASAKLSRGMNKPILATATPRLPRDVATRPKMGFTLPLDTWFRGAMRERLHSLLVSDSHCVLSRRNVEGVWSAFLEKSASVSFSRIWTIAAASEWMERHGVRSQG
jgi:asparagine synthase (glutamine-hydrolysing)